MLVFGGTGLLGAPLVLQLVSRGYQVFVASSLHRFSVNTSIQSFACDVGIPGAGSRLLREVDPHWVINCAAVTDVDACEAGPVADRVNAQWPRELATAAAEAGVRCVHISTDSVFERRPGQAAPSEGDPRSPVNAYARQKAKAEEGVLDASNGRALVVRTNFFGWSPPPARGLAEWALRELRRRRRIRGFDDVYFNPLYSGDAVDLLLALMEANAEGLIHMLGSQCLSKLSFLRSLATVFSLDKRLVDEARLEDAQLAAPRPLNTCLSTTWLRGFLGRPLPSAEEGLRRMLRDELSLRAGLASVQEWPGRMRP